jgi:bifunctional DNA-binding transcriptional regulator/antitoxin component of YhaV-PrlF toxin-antitoxin module
MRITSKRQATLPVALCQELGVGPGDTIELERRVVDGVSVWILRPRKPDWSWLGCLKPLVTGKSHDWATIERAIERGWADEARS